MALLLSKVFALFQPGIWGSVYKMTSIHSAPLIIDGEQQKRDRSSSSSAILDCSQASPVDTALQCLSLVAGFYRIQADARQLRHELALGDRVAEATDILRAARLLGLKAKAVTRNTPEGL